MLAPGDAPCGKRGVLFGNHGRRQRGIPFALTPLTPTAAARLIVCQAGGLTDDQSGVSNRDQGGEIQK